MRWRPIKMIGLRTRTETTSMLSVNTNYRAMLALQSLTSTQEEMGIVQGRINSGLKIASAADNGAIFAIAQGQRSRMSSLSSIKDGLDRTAATMDIGISAGTAIAEVLQQMRAKAVNGQSNDLTTEQRNSLQADYDAMRNSIAQIAGAAQFNGLNLIGSGGASVQLLTSDVASATSGRQVQSTVVAGTVPGLSSYVAGQTGTAVVAGDITRLNLNGVQIGQVTITGTMTIQQYLDGVSTATGGRVTATYDQSNGQFTYRAPEAVVTTNELSVTAATTARSWLGHSVAATAVTGGGSSMTITDWDWTAGGAGALSTVSTAASLLSSAASATTTVGNLDTAINTLNVQLATLGAQAKAVDIQNTFLTKLRDVVEEGISNLVDADLAKESARLQSLQIKQQLGTEALSIANQAPQFILSLFR
jgi:flagellin